MEFWQEKKVLRIVLMITCFVIGLGIILYGWKLAGSLTGLGIMLVGLALLLFTLYLYNKPFTDIKKKNK